MVRFTYAQTREFGQTFLSYQSQQPGGLPTQKTQLRVCYDNFCALLPGDVHPRFYDVINVLIRARLLRSHSGEVTFLTRHVVDHTVALRTHNAHLFCEICRVLCTSEISLEDHKRGRAHQAKERVKALINSKADNEKDKGGIKITNDEFGVLNVGNIVSCIFTINNIGSVRRTLEACEFVRKASSLTLSDPQLVCGGLRTHTINPGGSYCVTVTCNATNLGYIRDILIFRFHGFNIYRYITIQVDAPGSNIIAPTAPYRRPPPVHRETPAEIIPGIKVELPPRKNPYKPLPQFDIPDRLFADINRGAPPPLDPLSAANYVKNISTLLHIEEVQMNVDIRTFDTESSMQVYRGRYILKIPGLAENRPSVLMGDSIFVKVDTIEYEGVVHNVGLNEVYLRLDPKFDRVFKPDRQYKIRFSFKRTALRRMHEAISQSAKSPWPLLPALLFPSDPYNGAQTNSAIARILAKANQIAPINRYLNQQQMRAVAAIVEGVAKPAPYLVYGPPGTGKTMTIVEAIGQIYRSKTEAVRILACAPSNNAADLIADRLIRNGVQLMDIYRFNAFNRARDDNMPEQVKAISTYDPSTGTYEQLPKAEIEEKKIVISTCINAGQLYSMSILPFTHIFVDEVGQATEPECLVSLSALAGGATTVVLAGDPKQLGPVIRSPYALLDGQGLGRSLLERLISNPIYRRDVVNFAAYGNYNIRLITKLINNYRSHPEIIRTPNELFYDNELVPMADIARRTALCHWDGLPTAGFPMVFHGLEGKDEREGNSPSWFNVSECIQVYTYIKNLMALRRPQITANDIGVITPYRKQAEKIRKYLQANHLGGISVGSVEQFQGQERLIIIVSCVRSNSEFVEFDYKHNLGFLKNPKRFNVAITRPQALLIIIGNPRVLAHDQHWARLLWYIIDHGGYTGSDRPPRGGATDAMEEVLDVFNRLRVGDEDVETMQAENPEWRIPN